MAAGSDEEASRARFLAGEALNQRKAIRGRRRAQRVLRSGDPQADGSRDRSEPPLGDGRAMFRGAVEVRDAGAWIARQVPADLDDPKDTILNPETPVPPQRAGGAPR